MITTPDPPESPPTLACDPAPPPPVFTPPPVVPLTDPDAPLPPFEYTTADPEIEELVPFPAVPPVKLLAAPPAEPEPLTAEQSTQVLLEHLTPQDRRNFAERLSLAIENKKRETGSLNENFVSIGVNKYRII